ncbi:VWA domain-containing protein [Mycobacterium sp. TY815]|uniref:VWA domain-containing protein n=1 Tax=Mycobacterium sp. TY815 TaxID=3050581 RepID=UPI0027411080|nr:VWA domain-containing protein [Mycobacterium sp. TY815]MDP7707428.1 VWA domain-containing protein [Mycobacterium sp. TY815]
MTFEPVLPAAALLTLAALLVVIRMAALYRVLVRTGKGRYRRVVARWAALTAAGLLLVLAAARPGLPVDDARARATNKPAPSSANVNVFFVVDRSVDGRVEDYAGNASRMSGIRSDIAALIDQYPRARFAVISFASRARLDWPLSDDVWSLKPLIAGLSPYTEVPTDAMFTVNVGAANDVLRTQLFHASTQYRDSKNLVFYFGEGAGGSRAPQSGFDDLDHVAGGAVLGYGSTAGGPIPQQYVNGSLLYMWDQQNNRPAHSALNEASLKAVAGEIGVPYFHRDNAPITAVVPALDLTGAASDGAALVSTLNAERRELYWYFTGLAAVLLLAEIAWTLREFRLTAYQHRPARR